MIVIVARRVTTHIIGKPRGSFVGAKKEFLLSKMQGMLPRCLDRFFLLLLTLAIAPDAEEEEKHPLIVVLAIYCQKNKT